MIWRRPSPQGRRHDSEASGVASGDNIRGGDIRAPGGGGTASHHQPGKHQQQPPGLHSAETALHDDPGSNVRPANLLACSRNHLSLQWLAVRICASWRRSRAWAIGGDAERDERSHTPGEAWNRKLTQAHGHPGTHLRVAAPAKFREFSTRQPSSRIFAAAPEL